MDEDYGILEETALEEHAALIIDMSDDEFYDDDFDYSLEYEDGYEDYEPSPYDGTYSED